MSVSVCEVGGIQAYECNCICMCGLCQCVCVCVRVCVCVCDECTHLWAFASAPVSYEVKCHKTLQLCGFLTGKQRQATGNCTGRMSADGSEPESASIPWLGLQCVSRKGFTNFKTTTNSEYWLGRIYGSNILKKSCSDHFILQDFEHRPWTLICCRISSLEGFGEI